MADNEQPFPLLIKRMLEGNEEATKTLLDDYAPAIRYAVRRRLHHRTRSKFDSLDFVQDVWASFFANPPAENAFREPKKFIAFLTRIAQNKVADATRQRMKGRKYNVNREHSLENSTTVGPNVLVADQSTPSQVVTRREEWNRFLSELPPAYQRIMVLLREGKKTATIAEELGLEVRSVQRIITKILSRFKPQ